MHHLDRPIASELSYLALQKRRERGEVGLSGADCTCQRLYPVPSFVAKRRAFIPDVEEDTDAPVVTDRRLRVPEKTTPVWFRHR